MSAGIDGIRAYFQFLTDPASLRDQTAIDDAKQRLDTAATTYERVLARGALNQAETIDADTYRAAFVKHGKAWADEHGITVDDLRAEGVPDHDLRDAGLLPRSPKTTNGKRTRTTVEAIQTTATRMPPFTKAELEDATGASPMSVRKAIRAMLEAGTLESLGPDRSRPGRGRAPIRYVAPGASGRRSETISPGATNDAAD